MQAAVSTVLTASRVVSAGVDTAAEAPKRSYYCGGPNNSNIIVPYSKYPLEHHRHQMILAIVWTSTVFENNAGPGAGGTKEDKGGGAKSRKLVIARRFAALLIYSRSQKVGA